MNNHPEQQPASSFGLDDALYLLFRHKWKIVFFTLLGLAAAGALYVKESAENQAEAKLFVRYITEKKNILDRENAMSRPLDPRDMSIMNAEAEILQSSDSILEAAKSIGPDKILAPYGGGTNAVDAARLLTKHFEVEIAPKGAVMILTLNHRDGTIATRALQRLIDNYLAKHAQVHSSGATYSQVSAQTDAVRGNLAKTEDALKRLKALNHISNLERDKTDLSAQSASLQQEIFLTEAQLAEVRAQLEKRSASDASGDTNTLGSASSPSPLDISQYIKLAKRLDTLHDQEFELLGTYAEESSRVQQVRKLIAAVEKQMASLNVDPSYLMARSTTSATSTSMFDPEAAHTRLVSLEAKHGALTNSFLKVRAQLANIESVEDNIIQLERKKKAQEDEYAYYTQNLDQMNLDELIAAGNRDNIRAIQDPTLVPPDTKKRVKKLGGVAAAGFALGILLAFLSDFVFNPSVKRPKELELNLGIPVFATIPEFGRHQLKDKRSKRKSSELQENGNGAFAHGEIPPWEDADPLLPYYEALRDRVVMSYAGDLHKPKIVGLTSCNSGSGVTRLATGLAASLSRDAERNVLLVGLERNKVAVSAFAKGRPTDGLEAPETETKTEKELVAQNLYSLATTGRNLAGASVVQSFSELLPKLKISDYDFIIFDLPPLTQTSGSLRLASQMERTLLVVEAEETNKDKVKRARNLLRGTQVFGVLNKAQAYGPKSIQPDL